MHRFFLSPQALLAEPVRLEGELAHQIARVLRLPPGEIITLLDNSGAAWAARLLDVSPRLVTATLLDRVTLATEPRVHLTLYQAVPRAKKIEWVLQKGTELGVSAFVPVLSARCQGLAPSDFDEPKLARWRKIVAEAAEQSGRAVLPTVAGALPFEQAVAAAATADLALIATVADGEPSTKGTRPLRAILDGLSTPPQRVALLVGPEGGFGPAEVALAEAQGVQPVSLGPRVLRTETAALVAFSAILYALGELD